MLLNMMMSLALMSMSDEAAVPERPGLLDLAPAEVQAGLRAADRHILVVRHARKIAPDCNGMTCPLSPQGEAMVARLAGLIGTPAVDRAYSSAACRTYLTAVAGGADVVMHQAVDGYEAGCEPDAVITRMRADAFADVRAGGPGWTLVAEHSNTSCLWIAAFAGDGAAAEAGCSEGRLPETAYGDIYWLHSVDDGQNWSLTVLPGAFDQPAP